MAVRPAKIDYLADNLFRVSWTGLANGDTGEPVCMPFGPDKTAHIRGTFGVGGSMTIKGTNEDVAASGTDPAIADPQGNAITKTAEAVEAFLENPYLIYPHVTAGDGTTALTCRITVKR